MSRSSSEPSSGSTMLSQTKAPGSSSTTDPDQLLSSLLAYGVGQLSTGDQQEVFSQLFSELSESSQIHYFQKFAGKFFSKALIILFKQLRSNNQQQLIDELVREHALSDKLERLPEESEDSFRLRVFVNLLSKLPWHSAGFTNFWQLLEQQQEEANRCDIRNENNDDHLLEDSFTGEIQQIRESVYAELLLAFSIFCFKTGCSPGNQLRHIRLIQIKYKLCDAITVLPDESEKDFRVRRFTELFKKLEMSSQHCVASQLNSLAPPVLPHAANFGKRNCLYWNTKITISVEYLFYRLLDKITCASTSDTTYPEQRPPPKRGLIRRTILRKTFFPKTTPQFIRVKQPDLRGVGGSTTTTTASTTSQRGRGQVGVRNDMVTTV